MSTETFLKLSSVVFAGLWCLLVWWSAGPVAAVLPLPAHIIFAVFVGALCSWLYETWFLWYIERGPLSTRSRALAVNPSTSSRTQHAPASAWARPLNRRQRRRMRVQVGLRSMAHV